MAKEETITRENEERDRNFRLITLPQIFSIGGRIKTGMNVSFISFYEITSPFNPLISHLYHPGVVMAHAFCQMTKRSSFLCR